MTVVRRPGPTDRTVIVGQTGSGKTFDAMFLFACQDYVTRPYYVMNGKGDPYLDRLSKLENVKEIELGKSVPTEPGIYILRPIPEVDDEALDSFFWQVWENENAGLYCDEGYLIRPQSKAFTAILTQGRSKNIGSIILTQRPIEMNRFALSEAQFIQVKQLSTPDDIKRLLMRGVKIPPELLDDGGIHLPDHFSLWYDVAKRETVILRPVPGPEIVLPMIQKRIAPPEPEETIKLPRVRLL